MKESILKTDSRIIFKETFGSEDLVRANGGTPTAGTSNITIGNDGAGSYTFDGQISNVRIIDGILSTQEIAQLWQDEKSLYNL